MKKIPLMATVLFLLAACNSQQSNSQTNTDSTTVAAQPAQAVTLLNATDFATKLQSEQGMLIDVRTPGEYKKGFIKGATLMDIFGDNFDADLNKLDRNQTYFVYCAAGGRSAECAEKMQLLGFKKVYDLDGGMGAWRNAGLPVEMPQ